MNTKTLFIAIGLIVGVPIAWAQGTLTWYFDNTDFIVQPTDQILLTGTITNLSDQPYTIPGAGAVFTGDLQTHYNFTFQLNLFGNTVPGDGTLEFTYGTLTPIGGHVSPGVYYADPAGINVGFGLQYSENTFQIDVVPEPSSLTLIGVGLSCLCVMRLSKQISRSNN